MWVPMFYGFMLGGGEIKLLYEWVVNLVYKVNLWIRLHKLAGVLD